MLKSLKILKFNTIGYQLGLSFPFLISSKKTLFTFIQAFHHKSMTLFSDKRFLQNKLEFDLIILHHQSFPEAQAKGTIPFFKKSSNLEIQAAFT